MGTNGTMFSEHLKQHRETAQKFLYELDEEGPGPIE